MDPTTLRVPLGSLEGAENARIVSIAFFALFVYEWLITLDKEVTYFWSGPWTASRLLFFLNRYLPPLIMIVGLVCFFIPNPTPEFCGPAVQFVLVANIAALGIIQAMLLLRVWYLFPNSPLTRGFIVMAFIISFTLSLVLSLVSVTKLVFLPLHPAKVAVGCQIQRPTAFWRMFLPSLILHTLLYVLTAWRALRNRRILKNAPVLKRLLRDGGCFYFIVLVTVGFSSIGSFLTKYPLINIPVIFSDYLLSITSIAVSRVMFSIHSLAECYGSDTAWLLNNAELSRVGWRQGTTSSEIIVEKWTVDSRDEEETGYYDDDMKKGIPLVKITRVGVYHDDAAW